MSCWATWCMECCRKEVVCCSLDGERRPKQRSRKGSSLYFQVVGCLHVPGSQIVYQHTYGTREKSPFPRVNSLYKGSRVSWSPLKLDRHTTMWFWMVRTVCSSWSFPTCRRVLTSQPKYHFNPNGYALEGAALGKVACLLLAGLLEKSWTSGCQALQSTSA